MHTFNTGHRSIPGLLMGSTAMAMLAADGTDTGFEQEFSLADLADIDVSDIEEIRFEIHPMGVYVWKVIRSELLEYTNKDDEKRAKAEFELEIMEVKSLINPPPGVTKESLVGKKHVDISYINPAETPEKIAEAIGRIRARITDMGGDSAGKLGLIVARVAESELVFTSKLIHQPDRNDKSIKRPKIQLEPKRKVA